MIETKALHCDCCKASEKTVMAVQYSDGYVVVTKKSGGKKHHIRLTVTKEHGNK